MKKQITSIFWKAVLLSLLFVTCIPSTITATEVIYAEELSGADSLTEHEDLFNPIGLFDGSVSNVTRTGENGMLTLEHPSGIGSLYLLFDSLPGIYTVTDNTSGVVHTVGTDDYYHQFLDLTALFEKAPASVTLDFRESGITIMEIRAFTAGEVPEDIQRWEAPADGKTDLILFSTHGDDEQLFFAGLLPYYAGEMGHQTGYEVQVVYMTDHRADSPHRIHEMLNGLWSVGVRNYPIYQDCPDFLIKNDMAATYAAFENLGFPRQRLLGYVVEQLRRFRPLVAVGHDINGEYGHGMHMVYADLLMEAVTIAGDPTQFPQSAEQYGLWDTPKTYLHLYEENPIVMDWDQPLQVFDGMTAFEVTQQLGYPCHESQFSDFAWYLSWYDTAKQVPHYSPCNYGLYRTTVGLDIEKDDLFENLTCYAQQARLEEEKRLEEERLEAQRLEALRLEEEARLEAQRQEQLHLEEERRLQEEERQQNAAATQQAYDSLQETLHTGMLICCGFIVLFILLLILSRYRKP